MQRSLKKNSKITLVFLMLVFMLKLNNIHADEHIMSMDDKISDFSEMVLFDNELFSAVQKISSFKNGHFFVKEITDKTGTTPHVTSFFIPGEYLRVKYVDSAKNVVQHDYSNGGTLPLNSILMIETGKINVFLSQPIQFIEKKDKELLERQTEFCYISAKKEGNYYRLFFHYPAKKGVKNVQWALTSEKPLLDFNIPEQSESFKKIDLTNKGLLSYDGYIFEFHASKPPLRDYFLIPSPYLGRSFVSNGKSRLYDIMGQVLLKLAAENINNEGFFPVKPKSDWLYKDYGITAPYFDNRWNADLAITMMECAERWDDKQLKYAYQKLLDFFCDHVSDRSYNTKNGGYLNYDYASPGKSIRTHMALNHQLAVIGMFYKAYNLTGNDTYRFYADRLLRGIEAIGDKWAMPSGDLHYALLPNGNLGLKDYPTLTYNDMFSVQNLIENTEGKGSKILAELMEKKKSWMDKNGYKGKYNE